MENIQKFISNLAPLAEDLRDFPFHKVHGEVKAPNIPDFDLAKLIALNQYNLEECAGASTGAGNTMFKWMITSIVDYLNSKGQPSDVTSRGVLAVKYGLVSDVTTYCQMAHLGTNGDINAQLIAVLRNENGDYFDFLYQYAKICQVMGNPTPNGADLRSAMQALVTYGSLPKNKSPFTFGTGKPTDRTPQQLADWKLWPASLDTIAAKNKINSYFAVTGSGDAFDNMISAMWLGKAPVIFGLYYKTSWVNPLNGIIIDDGSAPTENTIGGHAMAAFGKKTIVHTEYVHAQQSWGEGFGDHGTCYFPRSVINQMVAIFGSFVMSNLSKTTTTYYLQNGIQLGDNWLVISVKTVYTFISDLFSKK